ncbi:MAG: SEL1-like repeat protein [Defluviitaleaceae bacterium]|nr:SEL1-like repeat protein [Defluviitaleaceae bacterium]
MNKNNLKNFRHKKVPVRWCFLIVLGFAYEMGRGASQNSEIAMYWYHKAYEQGDIQAKDFIEQLELQIN